MSTNRRNPSIKEDRCSYCKNPIVANEIFLKGPGRNGETVHRECFRRKVLTESKKPDQKEGEMKPSERIREIVVNIRKKIGGSSPMDWTTATIEYLDEQHNSNEQGGERGSREARKSGL